MQKSSDPLELARRIGRMGYDRPGEVLVPEMEIAYILKAMRKRDETGKLRFRMEYDDRSKAKLNRNVLVIAEADMAKTTIANMFFRDLTLCVPYISREAETNPDALKFIVYSGGTTLEATMGGGSIEAFDPPMVSDAAFAFAGELSTVLGHGKQDVNRNCHKLNELIHDGNCERNLRGMKGASLKKREEFRKVCDDLGIHFNVQHSAISAPSTISMVACTHEPDAETWAIMREAGLIGRFALVEVKMDEEQLREYYVNQFSSEPDPQDVANLRIFNDALLRIEWKHINYPPPRFVRAGKATVFDEYGRICSELGTRLRDIKIGREHGYIAQYMTARAAIRHVVDYTLNHGHPPAEVDGLTYISQDADEAAAAFIKNCIPAILYRAAAGQGKEDKTYEESVAILREFVTERAKSVKAEPGKHFIKPEYYQVFRSGELKDFFLAKKRISRQAYYPRRTKLSDRGDITNIGQEGSEEIFRVADKFVREVGYTTISERDAYLDRIESEAMAVRPREVEA